MTSPADTREFPNRLTSEDSPRAGKPKSGLRFKTYVLISLMVILNPVSTILLKKGMNNVSAMASWMPADVFHFFFRAFTTGTIWLAIGCQLAFFVAYMLVLSWADYTYVQPVAALSNGFTALLAVLLLHEVITPLRWAGIFAICLGVFIVGHTQPRTTE